jgi:hypothetical protein
MNAPVVAFTANTLSDPKYTTPLATAGEDLIPVAVGYLHSSEPVLAFRA